MPNEWKAGDRFLLRSGRAVGNVIAVGEERITVQYDNGLIDELNPIDLLHNVKPEPDPDEEED
jgi:hypothetical protein